MRSARAYRGSLDHDHVSDEMRNGAGSQFDPRLADVFLGLDLEPYEAMLAGHVAQDAEPS